MTKKDKNHQVGQGQVDNAGFIPYIQINEYFNSGAMYERYLSFLPSPKTGSAYLFSKPKVLSKMFNFMDPCFMKITSKLELTLNETCFRNFAMQLELTDRPIIKEFEIFKYYYSRFISYTKVTWYNMRIYLEFWL